jgi:DNA-binding NarL/FixJ family response regulator
MKTGFTTPPRSFRNDDDLSRRVIRTFLAEDTPLLMVLLARIVSKDERVVIVGSATDGRKALCNATSLAPELVISDLHLPGLEGADVTRRLKQRPNPPIVFVVTSDDTPGARTRSLAAGADAFLKKDGHLAPQLLSAIQEFFPDELDPSDAESTHLYERLSPVK